MSVASFASPRAVRRLAALLLAPAALAAQDGRRETDAFTWQGSVPSGRWIHVRNLNGPIRVERGGDRVEVRADRRWGRDGDPKRVRFTAEKARDGQGMVICAIWTEGTRCDEDGYDTGRRRWSDDEGDRWESVDFVVRVPEGVKVDVQTVNGGLEVRGATAEVVARTTNGGVRAETLGGPVDARTTNGSIFASMRSVGSARDLDFRTTNGSVTVEMPSNLGAELEMSTVNGRVNTEFPVTVSGRIDPRRLRATIGDGARRVRLHTVNGSVELRRLDR
ncbi:DUF4097 family beta strand repeat-containing protein [Roseisolibacter sp. H3M3-2]|uniref:DUF4097 family beta strand repeat-containing protein n=1 Tax=Roseisolibacter sp. H3M3-2 TaxID=3031323 RepID=UPI0023DBE26E|nr:DUF4097 family beta strand repeat-containing protein [Roseisolibacter sp. H3M3-2]MDF1505001.1 DUF4097 family beta strand repeat-containing protein [Roseisolibacter sp. H3M3-2]